MKFIAEQIWFQYVSSWKIVPRVSNFLSLAETISSLSYNDQLQLKNLCKSIKSSPWRRKSSLWKDGQEELNLAKASFDFLSLYHRLQQTVSTLVNISPPSWSPLLSVSLPFFTIPSGSGKQTEEISHRVIQFRRCAYGTTRATLIRKELLCSIFIQQKSKL